MFLIGSYILKCIIIIIYCSIIVIKYTSIVIGDPQNELFYNIHETNMEITLAITV